MRLAALMLCLSACAHVDPGTYCLPHNRHGGDTCIITDGGTCRAMICDDLVCLEETGLRHTCAYLDPWWVRRPLPARYGGDMQPGCRWVPDRDRGMMALADDCEAKP